MEDKEYTTKVLLKRFLPYYKKHWRVIVTDLFCAGLTTICDLVLPMIIRYITNTGMRDLASLTAGIIGKLALLYLLLRVTALQIIIWRIWAM